MINDYEAINKLIQERKDKPFRGLCENTYINDRIHSQFSERKDLKWVKVQELKLKYQWTDAEAEEMYNKTPDGWTDAFGHYRLFDFGKGENKVVKEYNEDRALHEPQHDHIVSRSEAKKLGWTNKQINHPSNIQFISAIQNQMKRDWNKDMWAAVATTIGDLFPK